MTRCLGLTLWSGAVLLTLVGLATAQRPARVPAVGEASGAQPGDDGKPADIAVPEALPPGALRDPTKASPKMRDVLNTKTSAGSKVSALGLRARIIAKNKPPAALLEVEGKLYAVGKGSVVAGGGNTILKVLDINSDGVRVESSPSKEIFWLR